MYHACDVQFPGQFSCLVWDFLSEEHFVIVAAKNFKFDKVIVTFQKMTKERLIKFVSGAALKLQKCIYIRKRSQIF